MGIFRQFPYTNFHEFNLDEIIKIMRQMQDEWEATKTEWSSYKEYIDNYFANLDVSQEVLGALRAMAATGELNTIMDPVIASEVTDWLEENITPTTPPVDASLTIEGAAADAKATGSLKTQLMDYNCYDILINKLHTDRTQNGITYSWDGDKCTLTGTASPTSFNNLIVDSPALSPDNARLVGKTLDCYYSGPNSRMQIYCYDSNDAVILNARVVGWQKITIPEETAKMTIRLYVQSGVSVNETVEMYIVTPGANVIDGALQPLKYMGAYPDNASANDADLNTTYITDSTTTDLPITGTGILTTRGQRPANPYSTFMYQTWRMAYTGREYYRYKANAQSEWSDWLRPQYIRFMGGLNANADLDTVEMNTASVASSTAVNAPKASAAYVYTIGNYESSHIQIWMEFNTGLTYYRHGLHGTYSNWIATGSGSAGNPNANMYSVGNSILTGSVWINGSMDHLCEYNNAPYGVIAHALNIPQANVEHVLHSSTGLLYDAGEGNFLTTIMAKDLSGVDVVLTHMWLADMNHFPVGALTDPAGTNTLVAAVKTLVNYIKAQNKNTQLVLVSVPPSSTTISGNNVFTGQHPNGSSIADLDAVMEQLADELHFTYVNFQDLNMSYWYQDLTDGSNVHLNNENSYRVLGAYLAGRASAKITF